MSKDYGVNGKPFFYELTSYPELSYPMPRVRSIDNYIDISDDLTWENYLEDTEYLLRTYDGITRKQITQLFPKDAFELILERLKNSTYDNERYLIDLIVKTELEDYIKYQIYSLALSLVYYYQKNVVRYFNSALYCLGNMELAHYASLEKRTPLGQAYYRFFNLTGLLSNQAIMNSKLEELSFPISRKYSDFRKIYGDILSMEYFDKKDYLHGETIYHVFKESLKTIQELDELYAGKNKIFGPDCSLDDNMSKEETEQVLYIYFQRDLFPLHDKRIIHGIDCYKVKEYPVWNLRINPLDFEGICW